MHKGRLGRPFFDLQAGPKDYIYCEVFTPERDRIMLYFSSVTTNYI